MRHLITRRALTTALLLLPVLFSPASRAEPISGCANLWAARTFALDLSNGGETFAPDVRAALERALPDLREVSPEAADLVIRYSAGEVVAHAPAVSTSVVHWRSDVDGEWLADDAGTASSMTVPAQVERGRRWTAALSRLDCQSPAFDQRPTRTVNGRCDQPVYVRVHFGTLESRENDTLRGPEGFAFALRATMFQSDPRDPCELLR